MLPGEGATTVDAAAAVCCCCSLSMLSLLCIPCVGRVAGSIASFGVSRVVCTAARSVLLAAVVVVVFELNLSMISFETVH